jgi:hypothetical protein
MTSLEIKVFPVAVSAMMMSTPFRPKRLYWASQYTTSRGWGGRARYHLNGGRDWNSKSKNAATPAS